MNEAMWTRDTLFVRKYAAIFKHAAGAKCLVNLSPHYKRTWKFKIETYALLIVPKGTRATKHKLSLV